MKIISSFATITGLTSSSENADFPDDNVLDLDPFVRWKADSYASDQWIKGQITAAITGLLLNQCNFAQATFQWNATDVWTSPSVEITLDLVQDRIKNRKGFFEISGTGAGYFRILIASGQTLDNSESVPAIGNVITGTVADIPNVARYSADIEGDSVIQKPYEGSPISTPIGRQRHVINIEIDDWWSRVREFPVDWTNSVIFADMGYADEAWLVFRPDKFPTPIKSRKKATMRLQLGEWN